jgi:hypothetical protein
MLEGFEEGSDTGGITPPEPDEMEPKEGITPGESPNGDGKVVEGKAGGGLELSAGGDTFAGGVML